MLIFGKTVAAKSPVRFALRESSFCKMDSNLLSYYRLTPPLFP
jgi:hypothetical protein